MPVSRPGLPIGTGSLSSSFTATSPRSSRYGPCCSPAISSMLCNCSAFSRSFSSGLLWPVSLGELHSRRVAHEWLWKSSLRRSGSHRRAHLGCSRFCLSRSPVERSRGFIALSPAELPPNKSAVKPTLSLSDTDRCSQRDFSRSS